MIPDSNTTGLLKNILIRYSGWGFIILSLLFVAILLVRAYMRVGEVERDNIVKQINLNLENGVQIRFKLNEEEGKPEILTSDNYSVFNIGAKDSILTVDSVSYPLWDQVFNYSIDRRKKIFYYTVSTSEDKLMRSFILEQVVRLINKNTAEIEYHFVWSAPVQVKQDVKEVILSLAHFNSGLGGLGEEGNKIKGQTQIVARRAPNPNVPLSYVPFEVSLSETLVNKNLNFLKKETADLAEPKPGFMTTYKISNPERGKRTFLARETVKLGNPFP